MKKIYNLFLIVAGLVASTQVMYAYPTSGNVPADHYQGGVYYALYNNSITLDGAASQTKDLKGPGEKMTFTAKRSTFSAFDMYVQGSTDNSTFSNLPEWKASALSTSNKNYTLNNIGKDIQSVKFAVTNGVAAGKKYVTNLNVTMAKYFEGAPASVTFPAGKVNGATQTSFTFKWCNWGKDIEISSSNPDLFEVTSDKTISAKAGYWNNAETVTVKCYNTSAGILKGSIYISDGSTTLTVEVISVVAKDDATIKWLIPENVAVGRSYDPAYEAPVDLNFTCDPVGVLQIEGTKFTAVGLGTTTVTASIKDDPYYKDATFTRTITVANKNQQSIVWNQNIAVIPNTTTSIDLNAYAVDSTNVPTGLTVTYESSNNSVATIEGKTLKIVGVGNANIKASVGETDAYFPASLTKGIIVYDPDPSSSCPEILLAGGAFELQQTSIGTGTGQQTLTWDAAKPAGTLSFDVVGNRDITMYIDVFRNGSTNKENGWKSIAVSKTAGHHTITLDENISGVNFRVDWTAAQSKTVTLTNIEIYQAKYVRSSVNSLNFLPLNLNAQDSTEITLNYSALQSMCVVSLEKEDKVFSLGKSGKAFGAGCGTVDTNKFTVIFSSQGLTAAGCKTYENAILITNSQGVQEMRIPISGKVQQLQQTIVWNPTTNIHTTDEITVPSTTDKPANLPIIYTSSDSATAYINNAYELVILKHGIVTITANAAGDNKYAAAAPVARTFTINPTLYSPELDAATLETLSKVTYGTTVGEIALTGTAQDKADNKVEGTFAFADPTLMPPPEATTEYEVIFTPSDLNYYIPVTITAAVTTTPRTAQVLTWNQNLAAISNTTESVTLNATVNTGLELEYTSSNPTIVTVEGNILKVVGVGRTTVTVAQEGTFDYLPISMSKIVEVYDPNVACGEALLAAETNVEFTISMWLLGQSTTHTVTWDDTKPTETLRFTAKGNRAMDMYVDAYKGTTKTEAWKTIALTTTDASYSYPLDADITKLEFRIKNEAAQDRTAYLTNIEVTQKSFMTPSITAYDFGAIEKNQVATKEVSIDYSALPTVRNIRLETEDNAFSLINNEAFGSGCGSNGTETFTMQFSTLSLTPEQMNTTFQNALLIVDAKDVTIQRIPIQATAKPIDWSPLTSETLPEGSILNYLLYSEKAANKPRYQGDVHVLDSAYYLMQVRSADDWHTFVAPFNIENAYVLELTPELTDREEMVAAQNAANAAFQKYLEDTLPTAGTTKDLFTIISEYIQTTEGAVGIYSIKDSYELHESADTWQLSDELTFDAQWTQSTDMTMKQGRTYAMKFPWCEYCEDRTPWDYWTGKLILFSGEVGQTIYGETEHKDFTPQYTEGDPAILKGNYTLADMTINNAYVHDITSDMYKPVYNDTVVSPTTSIIYAQIPTLQGVRAKGITRAGRIIYNEDDYNVSTQLQNNPNTTFTVIAQQNKMTIIGSKKELVKVYNIAGMLIHIATINAGEQINIPAQTGIYFVKGTQNAKKVLVP